jgi:GTP pyrophosphokinase
MSKSGTWVEVQIRTRRMDEIAERGYAAHWRYKSASSAVSEKSINNWLERIRDMLQGSDSTALDFLDDFQGFLFTDEIYVFTPQGELRNLPLNSTVLDFAYAIHSDIGNKCIGAKVNHKLTPLNLKLKSGDQVEIITSKKQVPKEEWFKYVVTARARTKLKQGIKEEKKKYAKEGEKMLIELFKEINIEPDNKNILKLQQKYNYSTKLDLFYDVAKGLLVSKDMKDYGLGETKESWIAKMIKRPFTRSKQTDKKTLTEAVIAELSKNEHPKKENGKIQKISYDIANCCYPIPGDEIVGFIDPVNPIKIHRTNCPVAINQMSKYGNRIIQTKWNDKESIGFLAGILIQGIDRQGLINDVIKVITENLKINIKSFHLDTDVGMIQAKIMLYVYSVENLNELIRYIHKIPNVKKVRRQNAPT